MRRERTEAANSVVSVSAVSHTTYDTRDSNSFSCLHVVAHSMPGSKQGH